MNIYGVIKTLFDSNFDKKWKLITKNSLQNRKELQTFTVKVWFL